MEGMDLVGKAGSLWQAGCEWKGREAGEEAASVLPGWAQGALHSPCGGWKWMPVEEGLAWCTPPPPSPVAAGPAFPAPLRTRAGCVPGTLQTKLQE